MACWRNPTGGVREALIKVAFSYPPGPEETAVAAQAGVPDAHNRYRSRTCGAHQIQDISQDAVDNRLLKEIELDCNR